MIGFILRFWLMSKVLDIVRTAVQRRHDPKEQARVAKSRRSKVS